jgi:hypothetical protein
LFFVLFGPNSFFTLYTFWISFLGPYYCHDTYFPPTLSYFFSKFSLARIFKIRVRKKICLQIFKIWMRIPHETLIGLDFQNSSHPYQKPHKHDFTVRSSLSHRSLPTSPLLSASQQNEKNFRFCFI